MTDPREALSDAALADELFAREREDQVAIHPAVGVRIRGQIEERLRGHRSRSRAALWIPLVAAAAGAALFLLNDPLPEQPSVEALVRAREHPLQLELGAGKRAELREGSALIPGDLPEVLSGEVEFRIAKLPAGRTFRVRAAGVVVEVIGTVFTVRRDGARVEVAVEEGAVRVFHQEVDRVLGAGERWSNVPPEAPPESRAERILEESYRRALQAKRSRPRPRMERAQPPPDRPARVSLPPEQRRSLLVLAAERSRRGDIDGARAIYRELGAHEPLGLYLLARLEARHAGRPQAALAALDELMARFPDHALAAEARASRIEALLDLSRCEEAGRALAEFTALHPAASDLIARSKLRHRSDCSSGAERSGTSDH